MLSSTLYVHYWCCNCFLVNFYQDDACDVDSDKTSSAAPNCAVDALQESSASVQHKSLLQYLLATATQPLPIKNMFQRDLEVILSITK